MVIQIGLTLQLSAAELFRSAYDGSRLSSSCASTFHYHCGGSGAICLFSNDESSFPFVVSIINISACSEKCIYDFGVTFASRHVQWRTTDIRPCSHISSQAEEEFDHFGAALHISFTLEVTDAHLRSPDCVMQRPQSTQVAGVKISAGIGKHSHE